MTLTILSHLAIFLIGEAKRSLHPANQGAMLVLL